MRSCGSAVGWLLVALFAAGCPRPGAHRTDGGGKVAEASGRGKRLRIVIAVNDSGTVYPGIVANDGAQAGPRSRFAAAGLDVELKVIRGAKERQSAFDSGAADVMVMSLDSLAALAPAYRARGIDLQAFLMVDWSRGNHGLVTAPKVKSVEALRDGKIATVRRSPAHFLLLTLLENSNLAAGDVAKLKANLQFAPRTVATVEMFRRDEVEAAAIWEPHLSEAAAGGKGRLLITTATASHLIADVLFARAPFLADHPSELAEFARIWFEGVAQLARDPAAAASLLAHACDQSPDDARAVLARLEPATFADDREFFGIGHERAPFLSLFESASRLWRAEGLTGPAVEPASARSLDALTAIAREHADDKVAESFKLVSGGPRGSAFLTHSLAIPFDAGSEALEPDARKLIDAFAPTLAAFGNAFVRVEGNTDSLGQVHGSFVLSKKRAQAVVDYLVEEHGLARERLRAVGNGPDHPVASNATDEGRAHNRRTDFLLFANE